ncbi:hypothetical protein Pfo_028800 [Paulownia fortunei]|nr:hypothetical protein Pfo_028800 [Paulownia fortunei]
MWQVLLAAAAAAGSGILAKKLISPIDSEKPNSDFKQNDQECAQNKSSPPQGSIFHLDDAFKENRRQGKREEFSDSGKIFRFSSPEKGSKELGRILGMGLEGLRNGSSKRGKKNGSVEGGGEELVVDQRGNGSGRRISICLKKRRTGKHTTGKCEPCASEGHFTVMGHLLKPSAKKPPLRSYNIIPLVGVGVGIMYMMSAGNAEINRLNCAMDETVKTVQELKAEISRRKSSRNVHVSVAENEAEMNKKYIERSYNGPLFTKLGAKRKDNIKTFCPALTEKGECASSILVEDQQPEVLEMDRLEAEFESELQKLPWCATEGSGSEERTDIFEAEVLAKERQSEDFENSNSYQYNGVLPAELDQKLCHLLIEQQESQIVELEAELHQAHSKLHEKEAELQALKDCVKHEETEDHQEDVKTRRDGIEEKLGLESTEPMVGMKRTLGL